MGAMDRLSAGAQPPAATRSAQREASGTNSNAAARLERLAWWLDSSIPLPGGRYRIGFDPILGLLPGVGDLIGVGLSSYVLTQAARLGAPRPLLARMAVNIAIEAVVGIVPFVGDVFDAAWKANRRNVRLLAEYLERPRSVRRASVGFLCLLLAAVLVMLIALGGLGYLLLRWLFGTIQ